MDYIDVLSSNDLKRNATYLANLYSIKKFFLKVSNLAKDIIIRL